MKSQPALPAARSSLCHRKARLGTGRSYSAVSQPLLINHSIVNKQHIQGDGMQFLGVSGTLGVLVTSLSDGMSDGGAVAKFFLWLAVVKLGAKQ